MMHGSVELKSYSLYTLPKTNTNSPWIFHLSNIISDGICQRNLAPQESNRPRFATKKMQLYRLLLRPSALPVYLATWQQAAKENEEMVEWDISTMEKNSRSPKKNVGAKRDLKTYQATLCSSSKMSKYLQMYGRTSSQLNSMEISCGTSA